jgi:hypothetical protein
MNVEIGTEAVQFPEKEYTPNGFSLIQVNLLCGGTHAGHVALWDDRSPSSPCRLTGNYCTIYQGAAT